MSNCLLTPCDFLNHWQEQRRLTRRVIEAFPEDQLFTYHAPDMRHFGDLANEIHGIAEYTVNGIITGEWPEPDPNDAESFNGPKDKTGLLTAWDALTERMEQELPAAPPSRYAEARKLFWGERTVFGWALYALENEIHHRGQGYVYLRELGLKPPEFFQP